MFERLQKPFLTVETGEAYQPVRLVYELHEADKLREKLNQLHCCEKTGSGNNTWNWYWRGECEDLRFDSLDGFKRHPEHPVRLGTLNIREGLLYINLPSFKRACLAVPFFYRILDPNTAKASHADFINKVFGVDERLPHGFTELFKEEELQKIIQQRIVEFAAVQSKVEEAASAEDAFKILHDYTHSETQKRLPYAERFSFRGGDFSDPDSIFLGFYIFLRGRELVAIRRWFGETGYTLANIAEDTMQNVFGGMDIDIIE